MHNTNVIFHIKELLHENLLNFFLCTYEYVHILYAHSCLSAQPLT